MKLIGTYKIDDLTVVNPQIEVRQVNDNIINKTCSIEVIFNIDGALINYSRNIDGFSYADTWENAINSGGTSTILGYTNWKIPNINELFSIIKTDSTSIFNGTPLDVSSVNAWCSTTSLNNSGTGLRVTYTSGQLINHTKTSTTGFIICRNRV